MRQHSRFPIAKPVFSLACLLLALAVSGMPLNSAYARITGGEGNAPISDPGWPKGSDAIFNYSARVAWWEGPPFGGGQWHAEYRGDAAELNSVLVGFAKIDAKSKRIVVHDGEGHSFWLNPNRDKAKEADARIDWMFMVWQPGNWERLRKLPRDLNPTDAGDEETGPPVQLDIYAGNLRWKDIKIPEGLKVTDNRLEAHGFMPSDGVVLEGHVVDLATQKPLVAQMRLERVEPQAKGGYKYTKVAEARANDQGRWVSRKTPAGWLRVVVEAEGYAPRIAGYGQFDEQPRWHSYSCGLSRAANVSGRVVDNAGKPLSEVDVRLSNVVSKNGGRYESPSEYSGKTDADGRFQFNQAPLGKVSVWVHKKGYCRPGLGEAIDTPAKDVALTMIQAANLLITVDFAGIERPAGYIVQIAPEEGVAIGKWSGSGNIDAKQQISFSDVPPGKYVLRGQPNPSSADEKSKPLTVDLKGGISTESILPAKP